jgi:hypothetical protein
VLDQIDEHVEHLRLDVHGSVAATQLPPGDIDLAICEREDHAGLRERCRSARRRAAGRDAPAPKTDPVLQEKSSVSPGLSHLLGAILPAPIGKEAVMDRAEYLNAVSEYFYQGEVLGEAFFAACVALEADTERRRKWASLMQLESETKARLRPFLVRLGLSVAQDDVSARVAELTKDFASKPWRQHMEEIAEVTDFYLQKFRVIEAAAPASERGMAEVMVAHETALNRFARMELAGETEESLRDVEAQLRWPPFAPDRAGTQVDGVASFAAIRIGKLKPGAGEEFAARVRAGALPVMRQMEGFKGYYLVVGADETAIAISLFADQSVAAVSTPQLMPWIKENLGPLLASPTQGIDGRVAIAAE